MSTQESERLGGGDAPIRISARGHVNGGEPARRGLPALTRSAELLVFVTGVIALLIVAAVDSGFDAERAWTLITVLAAAYILRRR
jgi:hypothetical protein